MSHRLTAVSDDLLDAEQLDECLSEAAFLWLQRSVAVEAPHYSPRQFADLDDALAAQLDGARAFGADSMRDVNLRLEGDDAADVFVAATLAIDAGIEHWRALIDRLGESPSVDCGISSALAWMPASRLEALLGCLGDRQNLQHDLWTIGALSAHRNTRDGRVGAGLESSSREVRCASLRATSDLGRTDLLPAVLDAVRGTLERERLEACRAACRLGDRTIALSALFASAASDGSLRAMALSEAMSILDPRGAHDLLCRFDRTHVSTRLRIQGSGWSGNPRYVPWLIERMAASATARIAFEAFVNICGPDVNFEQMESAPPEEFEEGPSDDANDDDVELPEDVALPWPNVGRVKTWWMANRSTFNSDTRLLLGRPPSVEWCRHVLKAGFQRQRVRAAHHLCLIAPGAPLFPTSAPAWRQQRLMTGW